MRVTPLAVATAIMDIALHPIGAQAQDDGTWAVRTDIQGLVSAFSGTTDRDSLSNAGAFLRLDYLERGGFTLGYNKTSLAFSPDMSADVAQDSLFVSGRWSLTPDWARGRITLRLDNHRISNDGSSNGIEDVDVIAPQLSYLNYAKTFYWDLGFARSAYDADRTSGVSRNVEQLTPTLGFGFNEQRDWIQLRAYFIRADTVASGQGPVPGPGPGPGQTVSRPDDETTAVEFKWTHWPAEGFVGIDNFRFSVLIGERLLPVDHDAGAVYNLADLQTGGASLGAEWAIGERNRLLLLTGVEHYETLSVAGTYRAGFMYLNFSREWD